jgi:hypothetical protein
VGEMMGGGGCGVWEERNRDGGGEILYGAG